MTSEPRFSPRPALPTRPKRLMRRHPSALATWARMGLIAGCAWAVSGAATAQPPALAQTYQQPSAEIRAVLDAPGLPAVMLSPDQRTVALVENRRNLPIAELSRPVLRLAGKRIDAGSSGPQRVQEIESLVLRAVATADATGAVTAGDRRVNLPGGGGFHQLRWSPDSKRFLLNRRTPKATELWVGDTATGALRVVPGVRLNAVLSTDMAWRSANEVLVLAVPQQRGAAPVFTAPSGPSIQESMGKVSPERTQQDLLQNSQDEALFAHHASSVLRSVQLDSGNSREVSEPGLYAELQAVGNSGAVLTERLVPPFSYQVGWNDFARQVEVHTGEGRVLRDLGRIALRQGVTVGGVITGPRNFWASPHADAAVYWVEALDGGDPQTRATHRDRVLRLDPPYNGTAREVHRSAGRLMALNFLETPGRATVADFDRSRLWRTVDLVTLDGSAPARRLQDRSARDRYGDPGTPLQRTLANGRVVHRVDKVNGADAVWLVGDGASPQGELPFLDVLNLADGKASRRFQSSATHYERPYTVLADGRLLASRESPAEPPNLVLRSGDNWAQIKPLTQNVDPVPQLRGLQRKLVKFKRADGVEMSFWQVLPPEHKAGERRPTFVWAYPLEFTDAGTAGQVSGSANRYNRITGSNPMLLALDGFVVLMDATMPVVGDPKTVNDSFVEQITANARAIIDQAVALGASDPQHMVVGGHSYGAFMTANLLAHTDLFKAGIARSGAYNRSLTPFGFQSERRTYWEAQDVYLKLSPFNYADKLKEPLLLIHGDSDDNPGTFPIQTQRLYQALAGTGGSVRYVSLPYESHGYAARESVGHTLREMSDWMKRHTRDPRAGTGTVGQ